MNPTEVVSLVISCLQDVLSSTNEASTVSVDEFTPLIGNEAVLDSLGLVTLVIDAEERLNEEYDLSLTLADDRAMSQRNSPFRTVQSLADYICLLIDEK